VARPDEGLAGADSGSPGPGRVCSAWVWLLVLSAGLISGLGSWLLGEATWDWFPVTRMLGPGPPSVEEQRAAQADYESAQTKAVALALGWLGGALGLTLGLAGGLARGSVRGGAAMGLVGLAMGAGAGIVAAFALMPPYFLFLNQYPLARDLLIIPLLIHIGLWSPLGAAGGLAFGLGLGRRRLIPRALLGGCLGAVLGSVIYEVVGAVVFPLAMTTRPLSVTSGSRLLARLLIALLAAMGAAAFGLKPTTRHPPGAPK
jgi:hypothetical protein